MASEHGLRKETPVMNYEGDRLNEDTLVCVWSIDGVEVFRHPYKHILIYASMLRPNYKVRLALLQWAEMIVNPD